MGCARALIDGQHFHLHDLQPDHQISTKKNPTEKIDGVVASTTAGLARLNAAADLMALECMTEEARLFM